MPGSGSVAIESTPGVEYVDQSGCPWNDSCTGQLKGTDIGAGVSIQVQLIAYGNYYCENVGCSPEFPMNCQVAVEAWRTVYTNDTGATVESILVDFDESGDPCAAFNAEGPCELPGDAMQVQYAVGIAARLLVSGVGSTPVQWLDAGGHRGFC